MDVPLVRLERGRCHQQGWDGGCHLLGWVPFYHVMLNGTDLWADWCDKYIIQLQINYKVMNWTYSQIYELMGVTTEVERNLPGSTVVTNRVDTVFKVVTIVNLIIILITNLIINIIFVINIMFSSQIRLALYKLIMWYKWTTKTFFVPPNIQGFGVKNIFHAKSRLFKVFPGVEREKFQVDKLEQVGTHWLNLYLGSINK